MLLSQHTTNISIDVSNISHKMDQTTILPQSRNRCTSIINCNNLISSTSSTLLSRNHSFVYPLSILVYFLFVAFNSKLEKKLWIVKIKNKQHSDMIMEVHYTKRQIKVPANRKVQYMNTMHHNFESNTWQMGHNEKFNAG